MALARSGATGNDGWMRTSALLLVALAFPLPALAGGLFTPDTGTVGLGRGGAWTARASDVAGALFYNPAGLWQVDGWTIAGGTNLYSADRTFQRDQGERAEPYELVVKRPHLRPHPELGIAWGLPKPDLTFAIGVTSPIAPIQSYDSAGAGRYRVIEQELRQANLYLAAAIRPHKVIAIGASVQLVYMDLRESFAGQADFLSRNEDPNPENTDWDVHTEFYARSIKPQFNVGLMVMPTEWLRIGVSFDPPYRFTGTGEATLTGALGGESTAVQTFGDGPLYVVARDDEIGLNIGLPGHLRFGLDLEPLEGRLSFGLEAHFELWNGSGDLRAENVALPLMYDSPGDDLPPEPLVDYLYRVGLCPLGSAIGVDCGDPSSLPAGEGSSLHVYRGEDGTIVIPAGFRNTWSIRTGVEAHPHPGFGVRFGYLFESPAIPLESQSLTMHDGWKHLLSGGLTLRLGADESHPRPLAEITITYAHVWYADRTVSAAESRGRTLVLEGVSANPVDAGVYSADVNQLGLNVAFHIGAMAERGKKAKTQ